MTPGSDAEKNYIINELDKIEQKMLKLFSSAYVDAIGLGEVRTAIKNCTEQFAFDNFPAAKTKLKSILSTLKDSTQKTVIESQKSVANVALKTSAQGLMKNFEHKKKDLDLVENISEKSIDQAREASSESANGFKLSSNVWDLDKYATKEIEAIVQAGIRQGKTVEDIARSVTPYLKNPELENAEPEFQKIKTPQGVFASAYRNALRMARSEVTRAYDEAEWNSYQNDPLIVGFEVRLSNNHTVKIRGKKKPLKDVCDQLQGKYPKTFKFTGWHPQCRCTMIPIPIRADELGDFAEAEDNGTEFKSKNAVDELPENFTSWVSNNSERLEKATSLPYFISENQAIIDSLLHPLQSADETAVTVEADDGDILSGLTSQRDLISKALNDSWKKSVQVKDALYSLPVSDARSAVELLEKLINQMETAFPGTEVNDVVVWLSDIVNAYQSGMLSSADTDGGIAFINKILENYGVPQLGQTYPSTTNKEEPIVSNNENIFDENGYPQERKDKAFWDTGAGWEADKLLRPQAGDLWCNATEKEKESINEYTGSAYNGINKGLQGRLSVPQYLTDWFTNSVDNITSYIDKSRLQQDMWLQRGDDSIDAVASRINFYGGNWDGDLKTLEGQIMQEGGFLSTGSSKGAGFSLKNVIINIFAPKGTAAAYIEPVSAYGGSHVGGSAGGLNWDGKTTQQSIGEDETLIQRGSIMRITKVEKDGSKVYIDCEIIGQEIKDLTYTKTGY